MRTAIIDTGGGLRGIYAAGVFDVLLERGIQFDLAVGVSAGSANLASFLGGQAGRNHSFYAVYSRRAQYMSLWNFITKRNYVDLDYVYGVLSNADGENPLNYEAIRDNPAEFIVVATDATTGAPKYFTREDMQQDNYDICKASSAIPFACRPYPIGNSLYYDGALSDPIPVHLALERGCEKIVMLLTTPKEQERSDAIDSFFAKGIRSAYPAAAEKLAGRAYVINDALRSLKPYEDDGRLLIVSPDDSCGVRVLEKRRGRLERLYEKGRKDAQRIEDFL